MSECEPAPATMDIETSSTTVTKEESNDNEAKEPTPIPEEQPKKDEATNTGNEERHWDHINRKVLIHNMFKYTKPKELEKMKNVWLKDTDFKVVKHKKPPKGTWVLLTMENEEMVARIIKHFEDKKFVNKKGGVLYASRASDDNNGKRGRDNNGSNDGGRDNKRSRKAPEECVKSIDEVREKLTPFWKLSYEEQLDRKTRDMINKCVIKIKSEMKVKFRTLQRDRSRKESSRNANTVYKWIKEKKPVTMGQVIPAPKHFKYRNKSELTFGYRHEYAEQEEEQNDQETKSEVKEGETSTTEDKTDGSKDISEAEAEKIPKRKIIKSPGVGFMAAGWSGGVSDPHGLQNIPDEVCGISDVVNTFLRDSSIPPYNSREHRGVWRTLTIRTSDRTNECMIIVVHAPASGGVGKRDDGSDDYSATFEEEKQRLIKMLTQPIPRPKRNLDLSQMKTEPENESSECDIRVTSLFFQEYGGVSNPTPDHPVQHVYGKEFLEEKLLNCHFQISPGAFFQVTTEGAEVLYSVVIEKVKEIASDPKDTVLFDVCCGTGTIGLTCMKQGAVGKVVGIDIAEPAIKDAIINAEKNGYTGSDSTKFIASRAELVMGKEIREAGDCPKVAVVDPAREGLHQDVCRALRNETHIDRIVYVSCNPTGSLVKDAVMLCGPPTKKYIGRPFKITYAQPVDMFPLTPHCEMVLVFDRMSEEEVEGSDKIDRKGEDATKNDTAVKEEDTVKDDIKEEDTVKNDTAIAANANELAPSVKSE